MVRMIGRTKLEIASIKHPMAEDDRMLAAAGELDAIVVATKSSTQDILAASESIESIIRKIAGTYHEDEDLVAMTDQVANEIIKIFEACNFQDITGQRINKVIKIIRFIEERILSMINIWGAEAFTELPIPGRETAEGDEALMNGPQLGSQGITQDEINALFD
jgi:chemotaxis protein CheZ